MSQDTMIPWCDTNAAKSVWMLSILDLEVPIEAPAPYKVLFYLYA